MERKRARGIASGTSRSKRTHLTVCLQFAPNHKQTPSLCKTPPLSVCDTKCGLSIGRGAWTFPKGAWTTIRQDVWLNTPGKNDGGFNIWINGNLSIAAHDVHYRDDADTFLNPMRSAPELPGVVSATNMPQDDLYSYVNQDCQPDTESMRPMTTTKTVQSVVVVTVSAAPVVATEAVPMVPDAIPAPPEAMPASSDDIPAAPDAMPTDPVVSSMTIPDITDVVTAAPEPTDLVTAPDETDAITAADVSNLMTAWTTGTMPVPSTLASFPVTMAAPTAVLTAGTTQTAWPVVPTYPAADAPSTGGIRRWFGKPLPKREPLDDGEWKGINGYPGDPGYNGGVASNVIQGTPGEVYTYVYTQVVTFPKVLATVTVGPTVTITTPARPTQPPALPPKLPAKPPVKAPAPKAPTKPKA